MRNYKIAYSIISCLEVKAWECQVEKGTYQLPADSTFKKPLIAKDGYNVIYSNGKWNYEKIPKPPKPKAPTLAELKESKIQQLDNYHFNSSEIREIKINDYFILSLSKQGRDLISEQIQNLEQQIKLNVVTEKKAVFEYFYDKKSFKITLNELRKLLIFMLNITNNNYVVYKNHINTIKNLSTIKEVEDYDFTTNYLKNQKLEIK